MISIAIWAITLNFVINAIQKYNIPILSDLCSQN